MTKQRAIYRKHNDRTVASSTYHKKDGTAIRSKLKKEAKDEVDLEISIKDGREANH